MLKTLTFSLAASTALLSMPLLTACGSGGSVNLPPEQLSIYSEDPESVIFRANIGNTKYHTYTLELLANGHPNLKYTPEVLLPSAFFIVDNKVAAKACKELYSRKPCSITLGFKPTDTSDYVPENLISFSVGQLKTSIRVKTTKENK